MKNIREMKPISSITFANESERITLTEGDEVFIIIDDMYLVDYEEEYRGVITYITDEEVEIESNGDPIPWKYISTICHV